MSNGYAKSLPEVVNDLKSELKEFIATRLAMFRSEMRERLSAFRMALPALIGGLLLLVTCWLLFTALIVVAISKAFDSPWAPVYALLIVGGAYLLLGLMLAAGAMAKLRAAKLMPERTIRVLKQDEVWLRTEAKIQL